MASCLYNFSSIILLCFSVTYRFRWFRDNIIEVERLINYAIKQISNYAMLFINNVMELLPHTYIEGSKVTEIELLIGRDVLV